MIVFFSIVFLWVNVLRFLLCYFRLRLKMHWWQRSPLRQQKYSIIMGLQNVGILIIFSVLIGLLMRKSEKCRIFVTNKTNLD